MSSFEQGQAGGAAAERRVVVVGVDGSPGSRAALDWALAAAAERGARLVVVSAFPVDFYWTDPYVLDARRIDTLRADTQARASAVVTEALADTAGDRRRGADVPVEVLAVPGPAAEHLVHRSEDADLLVVGSRGRGAVRSTLVGSVALHCAAHARCPVVVVHPAPDGAPAAAPAPRVVVGIDRSEASALALRAALAEAARRGADVLAVAAYQGINYWSDLYAVMAPPAGQTREQALRAAQAMVADVLAGVPEAGRPDVRVVAEEGPPADVLVGQAAGAQLLVVGSRGRSRLVGMVLGSVALSCVLHAHCPVLIVHPPRAHAGIGHEAVAATVPVAG